MGGFIEGHDRQQASFLPACVDDYVGEDALVRIVDCFVQSLDLADFGFRRAIAAPTGRPGYHPGDMLRLYIWGYLNQLRSSRHLERACPRAFREAIGAFERRKGRLVKRQAELEKREEKVLVFGEPEARPMGYGRAPKMPSYNLQSTVDVGSGLIVHHDVFNDANDSPTRPLLA